MVRGHEKRLCFVNGVRRKEPVRTERSGGREAGEESLQCLWEMWKPCLKQ